ncbi:MAG: hypothetical protein IIC73_08825 [Armatimonadetes bacterium]|nr:hypothetical protein [Armatimonadota bacterium]
MRKTGATLAVLGLFLAVAVGCGSSNEPSSNQTPSNTLSGLDPENKVDFATARSKSIMGMTEQQVRSSMGNPYSKATQDIDGVEEIQLVYSTNTEDEYLRVVLEDDSVTLFELTFE